MRFHTLIRIFGDNDADIARGLKTSRQLVGYWREHGITPARAAWIREKIKGHVETHRTQRKG